MWWCAVLLLCAPGEYVARIRAEAVKALEDPDTRRKFIEDGFVIVVSTPQEFGKTIVDDIEFHRRLVARMGITPQ